MDVAKVSSNGLIYAIDPFHNSKHSTYKEAVSERKALQNILLTQDFDAIPLIREKGGPVSRVARRRLHTGDDFDDVFILDIEEVCVLDPGADIIQSLFAILSNEHHIVMIRDQIKGEGYFSSILTLAMLDADIVRHYISIKISELARKEWHWNVDALTNHLAPLGTPVHSTTIRPPLATYASQLFAKIKAIATMVKDPKNIPSDFDLSRKIVELLHQLQPLKEYGSVKHPSLEFPFDLKQHPAATDGAMSVPVAQVHKHPIAGVRSDLGEPDMAAHLLGEANDFTYLLYRNQRPKEDQLLRPATGEKITIKGKISGHECILDGIKMLVENKSNPILVDLESSPWPGILTVEDLIESQETMSLFLRKWVEYEGNLRTIAVGKDILKVDGAFIFNVGIKNLFKHFIDEGIEFTSTQDDLLSPELASEAFDQIATVRNLIIHNFFVSNPGQKKYPSWFSKLFLNSLYNIGRLPRGEATDAMKETYSAFLWAIQFFENPPILFPEYSLNKDSFMIPPQTNRRSFSHLLRPNLKRVGLVKSDHKAPTLVFFLKDKQATKDIRQIYENEKLLTRAGKAKSPYTLSELENEAFLGQFTIQFEEYVSSVPK